VGTMHWFAAHADIWDLLEWVFTVLGAAVLLDLAILSRWPEAKAAWCRRSLAAIGVALLMGFLTWSSLVGRKVREIAQNRTELEVVECASRRVHSNVVLWECPGAGTRTEEEILERHRELVWQELQNVE